MTISHSVIITVALIALIIICYLGKLLLNYLDGPRVDWCEKTLAIMILDIFDRVDKVSSTKMYFFLLGQASIVMIIAEQRGYNLVAETAKSLCDFIRAKMDLAEIRDNAKRRP